MFDTLALIGSIPSDLLRPPPTSSARAHPFSPYPRSLYRPLYYSKLVESNELLVLDWMAQWCRKCKYIKPKLEKLMSEEFPAIPVHFCDVNALPLEIVKEYGVSKMPTVQVIRKGEVQRAYVCTADAASAIQTIREFVKMEVC